MVRHVLKHAPEPESIERFIEDPALFRRRMIWHFPPPMHSPLSRQQVVFLFESTCESPVEPTARNGGEGVGEEPNHRTAREPGPL